MRIETPATTLALLLGCSGGGSVVPPWELPYDSDTDAATTTGSEASSTTIGTEPLDTSGSSSTGVWTGDGGSTTEDSSTSSPEVAPEPLPGGGNSDPPSLALHNACGGVEWQRIHGWLLHPHQPPVIGSTDQMERCEERFAGWVTHAADEAGLSRASVYAALAATGHCDEGQPYEQLVQPQSCVLVHPDLDEASCVEAMEASREFAIDTLGAVLSDATAVEFHAYDPPLMAAWLGAGEVRCDADDPWRHPWRLAAPPGYIDRYVAAYNAYKALRSDPPQCAKRIVVSVALYTGLDVPGVNDVAPANGCWTFERIAKENAEWKICNYDGTVHHPNGFRWVYDDTNTAHSAAVEVAQIDSCRAGIDGRGYVYMTNRGSGWPARVQEGVAVHFAEIYSSQYTVDDQFATWKSSGSPGEPMVNFGESATSATTIESSTARACDEVEDGGYLGVYVYPTALRGERMSAMVRALNACTEA